MRHLKLLSCSLLALGLSAGAANAVDLFDPPEDPGFDWTGFYAGVKGGVGLITYTGTVPGPVTGSWSATGFILGGLAGYNWQTDNMVFGVEADAVWFGANGTVNPVLAAGTSATQWTASLRGRAGYASDDWLVYVTGGVAALNNNINVGAPPINNTHFGAVVGVGASHHLGDGYFIGAELSYYMFESKLYNPDTRAVEYTMRATGGRQF